MANPESCAKLDWKIGCQLHRVYVMKEITYEWQINTVYLEGFLKFSLTLMFFFFLKYLI